MLNRTSQHGKLLRIPGAQKPGLCRLLYIPVERVLTDPLVIYPTGTISVMPTISSKFNTALFLNYSKDYIEQQKEEEGGDLFDIIVNGFLPFEVIGNHNTLNTAKHHRYIVLVTNPEGRTKWLGTKDNPVKLIQGYDSGRKGSSSSKGSTLSFVWRSEDKPLLVGFDIPDSAIIGT